MGGLQTAGLVGEAVRGEKLRQNVVRINDFILYAQGTLLLRCRTNELHLRVKTSAENLNKAFEMTLPDRELPGITPAPPPAKAPLLEIGATTSVVQITNSLLC